MPTDDEFRRVAEDVRALARSLARDIRGAVERVREDTWDPGATGRIGAIERAGRDELRRVRATLRQAAPRRYHHPHQWPHGPWWLDRPVDGPATAPGRGYRGGRRDRDAPGVESPSRAAGGAHPMARRRSGHPPALPFPALRHRHDGSTLLGLLAVVFGLAWLAAGTHVVRVSAEGVLAMALMVLGGAMVVTARTDWALSRRSWPLLAGAALVLALIASSASPPGGDFRQLQFGSRTVAPISWAGVPARIQGGIGRTVVDLRSLPTPPPAARALTIDGSVGSLAIELPDQLTVDLDGHIGVGRVVVNDIEVVSGFRQAFAQRIGPGGGTAAQSAPTLSLHVNSGLGSVSITDLASPAAPRPPVMPPVPVPVAP